MFCCSSRAARHNYYLKTLPVDMSKPIAVCVLEGKVKGTLRFEENVSVSRSNQLIIISSLVRIKEVLQ